MTFPWTLFLSLPAPLLNSAFHFLLLGCFWILSPLTPTTEHFINSHSCHLNIQCHHHAHKERVHFPKTLKIGWHTLWLTPGRTEEQDRGRYGSSWVQQHFIWTLLSGFAWAIWRLFCTPPASLHPPCLAFGTVGDFGGKVLWCSSNNLLYTHGWRNVLEDLN